MLLAYSNTGRLDRVLDAPLRRWTQHTVTAATKLVRVLAQVRENGVAISREQYQVGRADVATPIFADNGVAVASLEIVVSAGEPLRQHVLAVRAAAAEVSSALRATMPRRRS